MATYAKVAEYVRLKYGCSVKTCWIAHVKELNGLQPRPAPNRFSTSARTNPCPPDKRPMIEEAFHVLGVIGQ